MKGVGPEGGAELEEPGWVAGPLAPDSHTAPQWQSCYWKGAGVYFLFPELILFPSWPQIYPEKTLVFALAEV